MPITSGEVRAAPRRGCLWCLVGMGKPPMGIPRSPCTNDSQRAHRKVVLKGGPASSLVCDLTPARQRRATPRPGRAWAWARPPRGHLLRAHPDGPTKPLPSPPKGKGYCTLGGEGLAKGLRGSAGSLRGKLARGQRGGAGRGGWGACHPHRPRPRALQCQAVPCYCARPLQPSFSSLAPVLL